MKDFGKSVLNVKRNHPPRLAADASAVSQEIDEVDAVAEVNSVTPGAEAKNKAVDQSYSDDEDESDTEVPPREVQQNVTVDVVDGDSSRPYHKSGCNMKSTLGR